MNNIDKIFNDASDIKEFSSQYMDYLNSILKSINSEQIEKFVEVILEAREQESQIFFIGNGGSASTASHFANDMAIGTRSLDKPFKAISLTDNVSIISAIGNDYGFDEIFYQQTKLYLKKNDVLVAISASGNSKNLIKAVDYVNAIGGITIGISAFDGGQLCKKSMHSVHVPTEQGEYGPAEDCHLIINHLVSNYLLRLVMAKN